MANPLYNVPGLGGFLAAQDRRRAMQQEDMQGQMEQIKLADMFKAASEQQAAQEQAQNLAGTLGFINAESSPEDVQRHSLSALMQQGSPADRTEILKEQFKYRPPVKPEAIPDKIQFAEKLAEWEGSGIPENLARAKTLRGLLASMEKTGNSGGNPYSTPVYDGKGRLVAFDNRSGKLSVPISPFPPENPGEVAPPIVGAKYSPVLQKDLTAATGEGKALGEQRGLLPNQKEALISVQTAKKLLAEGIYAGGYSKLKMAGAKYTPGVDTDKAARTEQFISHIGNTVVPRLKEFGGSDTVEEMNYLREIMGGNITLEASALNKILDQVEAKTQRGIDRVNKGLTPDGQPAGQQPTTPTATKPITAAAKEAVIWAKKNPKDPRSAVILKAHGL